MSHILTVFAALLLAPGSSPGKGHAFNSGFGAARAGLRLAVQVDRSGRSVAFRVRNVGRRPVVVDVHYTCSGYGHWWLEGGAYRRKLSRSYIWSNRQKGLALASRVRPQVCTVNVPDRSIILKPGQRTVVKLPMAKGFTLLGANRFVQGRALLYVSTRAMQLRTPVARRLVP